MKVVLLLQKSHCHSGGNEVTGSSPWCYLFLTRMCFQLTFSTTPTRTKWPSDGYSDCGFYKFISTRKDVSKGCVREGTSSSRLRAGRGKGRSRRTQVSKMNVAWRATQLIFSASRTGKGSQGPPWPP